MATVASVYSVDPHQRTAEEITAALFREQPEVAQTHRHRDLIDDYNLNMLAC